MPIPISKLGLPAIAFFMVVGNIPAVQAQDSAPDSCHALRDVVVDGATVTSARVMDASGDLPAYCEVRATALPTISIEIRLPLEGWNGGFYQAGCGGFCGILGRADASGGFINAMGPGLAKGYATATSDSGHLGLSVVDAEWADRNPGAERDWGWRSIGETHRVAQAMIEAFYDTGAETAIFQGCSTGGRMANMAALRYPEHYDGIISGAPALDYTGLVATAMSWFVQANTDDEGQQILKPGKEALIGDEVMRQCDGVDGEEDGFIADPRACNVDLSGLECGSEGAGNQCLTPEELDVIAAWRQGPRDSAGNQLYPGGIPEGSERFWPVWLTGTEAGAPAVVPLFAKGFGAYMAFPDDPGATWSPTDFDFDTDPARLSTMAAVYNSDSTDLTAFREAGGKMIVWHGWADAIVPPYKTVEWFEATAEATGSQEALEENVKLYMIPGLDHCGIVPGEGGLSQADLDPLTAIETWMSSGEAPETITKAQ
ncbi:tannase/feruloyl esterase family alpha/beta hydrolase [Amaricoccus macauensis]|uniref:tannase/feruloyl esterase family alpha/beta hydrolase n=1 Tax=Amaricoccus macauensis TaxID=57001 RepID=UPI003C7D71CD